jgi:dihydroorotate dehydrogenase
MPVDLSVELAPSHKSGLLLHNPVMVASGTFGYGTEYASLVDIQRLGAIVSKGITLRSRKGNPQPRIIETPAGLLNSIGAMARVIAAQFAALVAPATDVVAVDPPARTAEA